MPNGAGLEASASGLVLGVDTSGPYCAGALWRDGAVIAAKQEDMARGQVERLAPFLEEMLADAGAEWRDITALGVGVGPGNFTGIRISLSFIRSLAMGLGIPAMGVSAFEIIAESLPDRDALAVIAVIPAGRAKNTLFQRWEGGEAASPVLPWSPGESTKELGAPALVAGQGADALAHAIGAQTLKIAPPVNPGEAIARIAARKAVSGEVRAPAPLYARPADAAPPRDAPPVLID